MTAKELARWIASEAGCDNPTNIMVEVWGAAITSLLDAKPDVWDELAERCCKAGADVNMARRETISEVLRAAAASGKIKEGG